MHHIGILKAAHHMHHRIHFPDIAQELIAQPLSLGGALHQTCNVHKLDHGRSHLLGFVHISQKLQPLVRHGHNAYIGIYGAEGIICRFRSRFCQGIK